MALSDWRKIQKELYPPESIMHPVPETSEGDYTSVLTRLRLDLVRKLATGKTVLDLCCATGEHLLWLSPAIRQGIGIDLIPEYIKRAYSGADALQTSNTHFTIGNAESLPVRSDSIDIAYSFSSLYIIPDLTILLSEIERVLRRDGIFVADFGNINSLNAWIAKHQRTAQTYYLSMSNMHRLISDAGFRIRLHRAFQILPYWTDRPRWLWPLLHPFWKRLMQRKIRGKMLDEHISSLPLVNRLAFRHLFVCEKG